jgi:hypothetical protein
MVKQAFTACANVDYLAWVCPKNYHPSDYISRIFSHFKVESSDEKAQELLSVLDGYKIMMLHRSNYLPKLLVREARIEDNDDLIPILQRSNPEVLEGQESYFLADLIQKQNNINSFYVGLRKNAIAGMLATSLEVNVSLIMKIFDIDGYPDLIVKKEERPLPPPLLISVVGDLRLLDVNTVQDLVQGMHCVFINAETMSLPNTSDSGESKSGGGEEKKDGGHGGDDASSPLAHFLGDVLRAHNENDTSGVPPPAVVLFGYPRSENEAWDRLHEMVFNFDYIVEIFNTTEDAEEDEEDEFMQHHLDAVEVLREQYFTSEGKAYNAHHLSHHHDDHGQHPVPNLERVRGQHKAAWRKVSVRGPEGGGLAALNGSTAEESDELDYSRVDAVQHFAQDLGRILDHRRSRIEHQRAKDNEEPPKVNAFAVTVFCMTEDYNSRGGDIIKIAFEDHPNHDYCLFMVDNNSPPSAELLRCMTYVKTRPGISFNQSLYAVHRSTFIAAQHMTVERLLPAQLEALETFAYTLSNEAQQIALVDGAKACLLNHDVDTRDNPAEICYAVKIGATVVGAVTLSRKLNSNEDAAWFRSNYHVDDLVNFERHRVRNQAVITQWVVDPIYSPFARRIVQDIMRSYGKSLLYFQCARNASPPSDVLMEFVALKPRRRMQAGGAAVEMVDRPAVAYGGMPNDCPLFCITKRFLSHPKDIVAKRVVVVGGSSHSYALLDTLCFVPYLTFPNLFLITETAPPPLVMGKESIYMDEAKFDDDYSGCFTIHDDQFPLEQELYAMGLGHKINVVRGYLTDIDRENKAIVISDETVVEYDVLVLSSSTQGLTSLRFLVFVDFRHFSSSSSFSMFYFRWQYQRNRLCK